MIPISADWCSVYDLIAFGSHYVPGRTLNSSHLLTLGAFCTAMVVSSVCCVHFFIMYIPVDVFGCLLYCDIL